MCIGCVVAFLKFCAVKEHLLTNCSRPAMNNDKLLKKIATSGIIAECDYFSQKVLVDVHLGLNMDAVM